MGPDCGFETNTKGEFKAHQRTHATYKQSTESLVINCDLCKYKCSSKTNLEMHMQTDHTDGRRTLMEVLTNGPFVCNFCNFQAKYQSNLRKHVRKNHPEAFTSSKLGIPQKHARNLVVMPDSTSGGDGDAAEEPKDLVVALHAASKNEPEDVKSGAKNATSQSGMKKMKPFQCLFCDMGFMKQDALTKHATRAHNILNGVVEHKQLQNLPLVRNQGQRHQQLVISEEVERLQEHAVVERSQPGPATVLLDAAAAAQPQLQHHPDGVVNISVMGPDKIIGGEQSSVPSGSIILQSLSGSDLAALKPVIISAGGTGQANFGSLLHPSTSDSHHFTPSSIIQALPANNHITLQHLGQAIPSTSVPSSLTSSTHHLMEPAQASFPVLQTLDGQTHYLIIQPQ